MNLDEVDGRFGEAWAGTSPDGSHRFYRGE
jgi:hypothetical protein